ncbi:hypothetical protein [Agaribacterium sp. ZY112]|uniref:hypothetical protein n=1 Tax=Agaribacterium sp. ZY112 TaxID=3233574 RepID=UPI003523498C
MVETSKQTLLFNLIREAATLPEAREFLAQNGLPRSASTWNTFFQERVVPALEGGNLKLSDLHQFLRETEEHGRQHVFLYKCSPTTANDLVTTKHLTEALKTIGKEGLLESPAILELPESPELVDARIDSRESKDFLVLKIAETRITRKEAETSSENGRVTKIYDEVKTRATNIVRLSQNGLLELRIASHSTNDAYKAAHDHTLSIISDIINFDSFNEVSLSAIKNRITLADEGELDDILIESKSSIRNGQGNCLTAATGNPTATLKSDKNIKGAIDSFSTDDSYCEHSNFWFIERDGESTPNSPINVVISGHPNEFRLGRKVTMENYEYTLATIWKLNTKVSK